MSGVDSLEAVFPSVVNDWFNLLNQGHRHTAIAASDTDGSVGEEPGAPRTFLLRGEDDPSRIIARSRIRTSACRGPATSTERAPRYRDPSGLQ